jgi:small subunit ribosomal protein S2
MSSFHPVRGQLRLLQKSAVRFNSTTVTKTVESVTSNENIIDNNNNNNNSNNNNMKNEVSVSESNFKLLNAHNLPYDGPLDQLSEMSEQELDKILSNIPEPTLNREEILNSRFEKLLNLYGNRDKLKKQFSSSSSLLSKFPNLIPSDKTSPYSQVELTIRQKHHAQIMGNLGSKIINVYKPHTLISNPPNINQVTVEKLLSSGAHLGRSTQLFNKNFQPFIYGKYKDLHIIDLDKTITYLKSASKVVQQVVENGGLVLFLGLKIGQLRSIKEASKRCNGYYVARKWIPGAITNSLENPKPRHEVDMQDFKTYRELSSDEANQVIKPDLIVILNPENASVAIKEANQARIPTIGIIDSNVDPNLVTYPIPANSSSNRTTNLICGVLGKAGETGLNKRLQKVSEYKKTLGMEQNEAFTEIERIIEEK